VLLIGERYRTVAPPTIADAAKRDNRGCDSLRGSGHETDRGSPASFSIAATKQHHYLLRSEISSKAARAGAAPYLFLTNTVPAE
jgi:hypothetical protein